MDKSFMSTKEFCERLQVSPSTVYRMINSRMIPAIKFGRHWKIPRSVFNDKEVFSDSYWMMVREMKKTR